MSKIISINHIISGNIFQEIECNDFDELYNKLKELIISYDADILIQLMINNEFLNNYNIIDIAVLLKLNECITVVFSNKKTYIV